MPWVPESLFATAKEVFVIGGGDSLRGFDFSRLKNRRIIAINAAGYSVPWADLLYFRDRSFVDACRDQHHTDLVTNWAGMVLTQSPHAANQFPGRVHLVDQVDQKDFVIGATPIKRGRSGGHTAVSLAIAMGARRVILLGIDCKLSETGRSHFHDCYTNKERRYKNDFLPAWTGWGEAAAKAGVTILNTNRTSALREFEFCDLDQIIGGN